MMNYVTIPLSDEEREALRYLAFFAEEAHQAAAAFKSMEHEHRVAMELSLRVLLRLVATECAS